MKAKISLASVAIIALLAVGATLGCQRSRTDAQVTNDVQSKINGDPAVQSRQYTVVASAGVVTLGGTVTSDTERASAAADAAQVAGVKTVVNNLEVVPAAAQAVPPPPPALAAPELVAKKHGKPSSVAAGKHGKHEMNAPAPVAPSSMQAAAPVPPPPPAAPPKPLEVTIPEGTTVAVRLVDAIDSERNHAGDTFRATLETPITVGDTMAIPAGAEVSGRVTDAKDAAHFSGRSALALVLTSIRVNGRTYELQTDQYARQGTARGKNTAEKVGGGAVLGAIIGGIAGGGKGAAIGAGVGAGAGGAVQGATRGQQVKLSSEQILSFHLQSPLTVTPGSRSTRRTLNE